MKSIYIPQLLKKRHCTEEIEVDDFIDDLETLTPVRGMMQVRHGGTYLEVKAQTETIITLSCDRCLQQYNYRFSLNTSEFIWLESEFTEPDKLLLEQEIDFEDLSETLPIEGYFEPLVWLYEQLCLAMPMRRICQEDCQGIDPLPLEKKPIIDPRWSNLVGLQQKLDRSES